MYFDLKIYNDAIEIFHKSIALYKNLNPTATYAYSYYYLGICYVAKSNFVDAKTCFDQTQSIFDELKITDTAEILTLQRGIISKSIGNSEEASTIFKTIIAKPDSPVILNAKAEALCQIGTIEATKDRYNLALNYLNKALQLN
ncbi:tetratricopeptide repeat protein [Flavobacterium sp. GB2R13]|uniref:tetratricopeptide repeat protein n=1 Tax=Flavobacterium algoris TaxID=3398733 RepID=UPI003A83644D